MDEEPLLEKIKAEVRLLLRKPCIRSLQELKFLQIAYSNLCNDAFITKRGLFYSSVAIFKSMKTINSIVKKYTAHFGTEMEDLKIKPGLKGLVSGNIIFYRKDGTKLAIQSKTLIPDMEEIAEIYTETKRVLVIEKDTVFHKATHPSFITVCGKGYPCLNTIKLLKMLSAFCAIFCVTDFDPFGIHIFLNYKKYVSIERLGISSADFFRYKIVDKHQRISLTMHDFKMIEKLKKTEFFEDALFLEGLGFKLEMDAIFSREDFEISQYFFN